MTLLGGFLGTGKTTTLTHLLSNREGLRIAVLVNDVAEVNVDAMSLRRTSIEAGDGIEMLQLENGCVCCSAAGDLVPTVSKLLERDDPFDHVVIEMSGVADPQNVQNSLSLGGISVDRKVALVDTTSFPELYGSLQKAREREDLTGAHVHEDDGDEPHACVVERPVVELLLQQIETADVILANKCDLASDDELRATLGACRVLNESAAIVSTTFGDAALWDVLPRSAAAPAAHAAAAADDVANGRQPSVYDLMLNGINCGGCGSAVTKALMAVDGISEVVAKSKKDSGGHPNQVTITGLSFTEAAVRAAIAKLDAGRGKYTIVEHDAPPQEYRELACSPARPTVPNSAEELGFTTHVFRARRPFNEARLLALCGSWPLPNKQMCLTAFGGDQQAAMETAVEASRRGGDPFAGVLRSKGTIWLDGSPREPVEWSHAGRHFQLAYKGIWWATLPKPVMRQCLPQLDAYTAERALFEGADGDRRQELVFIGTRLDFSAISAALEACLCTEDEMRTYRAASAEAYADAPPFRFGVGARVECNGEDDGWSLGTVVAHHYREPGWPLEAWAPYQIELDNGYLIFAPHDDDRCIRKASSYVRE